MHIVRHRRVTHISRTLSVRGLHLLILIFLPLCLIGFGTYQYTATTKGPRTILASKTRVRKTPPPMYQFPDGGRELFPNYRLVALYGLPGAPVLGALGEQSMAQTIIRVKNLAASYQPYIAEHALPTLEIIASVASALPTANNDYSQELSVAELQPWITAAQKSGVYVVLDLQSGRSSFLTQAKDYAPLLEQPNVGLALDPEWRLGPSQVPLVQIGSVNASEINATASWLAALTVQYKLPQKLLLLQQFRLSMITDRQNLNTSFAKLAFVIQMDGQGAQPVKLDTWHAVTADPPTSVRFGWKNFYHKDTPVLSPAQTMQLDPIPWYISYE